MFNEGHTQKKIQVHQSSIVFAKKKKKTEYTFMKPTIQKIVCNIMGWVYPGLL